MEKSYFLLSTLLALLLCQSCSSAPNPSGERAAGEKPKLKLNDLPNQVLQSIFIELELSDLINLASLNPKIRSSCIDTYENQYKKFEIDIEVIKHHRYNEKYSVRPYLRKYIIIYDYELAVKFLQYFGASIHTLWISNLYVTRDQSALLNKLANKYAAGALTSLNLDIMKGNTLEQFTTPFARVESLTCEFFEQQIGDNILPFDQLFPQLKRLTIKLNTAVDHKYLDCTLPHLEHLAITKASSDPNSDTTQIDNFIRKNAHINSVEVAAFPSNHMEFISNTLPNIDNLTVRYTDRDFPENYNVTQFQNVKDFDFYETLPDAIDQLTFPQLESVKLFYSEQYFENLLEFFTKHQHISKLHFRASWRFDEDNLKTLLSALPNLVQLTLQSNEDLSEHTIRSYIGSHGQLKNVSLLFEWRAKEMAKAFKDTLDGWNVKVIKSFTGDKGVQFTRKKGKNTVA